MKSLLTLATFIIGTHGYCWEAGKDPSFKGPPRVRQVSPSQVEVDWQDQIMLRECADNLLVKYWERANPVQFELSQLLPREANSVTIEVKPGVTYQFQAVAREDFGLIGGINWHKSMWIDFTTTENVTTKHDTVIQIATVVGLLVICVLGNV